MNIIQHKNVYQMYKNKPLLINLLCFGVQRRHHTEMLYVEIQVKCFLIQLYCTTHLPVRLVICVNFSLLLCFPTHFTATLAVIFISITVLLTAGAVVCSQFRQLLKPKRSRSVIENDNSAIQHRLGRLLLFTYIKYNNR